MSELRTYEIRLQRLGRFRWRRMVLINGNGRSGPEHETKTRWGALRRARREIRVDAAHRRPWKQIEVGLIEVSNDE